MRASVASTRRPEVLSGLGGFGSAVAIPPGMREPVLVSSTDGVGTKTAIAAALGRFDTIGVDLVAMCADDVVCSGAEPLAFLDYVAVSKLDPFQVAELVAGVADGCRQAGCALVGGETAEHPGLMEAQEFDLAGFCVGISERDRLLDGTAARPGDAIVGLGASGLHANGYSLVRALVAERRMSLHGSFQELLRRALGDAPGGEPLAAALLAAEPEHALATLGEVLLAPTRIYARDVLAIRQVLDAEGHAVNGIAHITGGGLPGNVPRALPPTLGARLDPASWPMPAVMRLMGALGGMEDDELRATFNGGLGMVLVVPAAAAALDGRAGARPRACRRGSWARWSSRSRSAAGGTRRRHEHGERANCGRGLGQRLQPAGARGGGEPRRAGRRDRARVRRPGVPGARAGRRSRGSRPSWCRVVTTRRWRRPCAAVAAGRRRARGLHAADRACGARGLRRPDHQRPSVAAPRLPGAHAVRDALAAGVAVTGVTVHLVDATLDGGPIVAQEAVAVLPDDDEASLLERLHAVEHRLLPRRSRTCSRAPCPRRRAPGGRGSTSLPSTPPCRCRGGRCCPCRTSPAWRTWGAGWWRAASSSCAPAGPRAPCARRACP